MTSQEKMLRKEAKKETQTIMHEVLKDPASMTWGLRDLLLKVATEAYYQGMIKGCQ